MDPQTKKAARKERSRQKRAALVAALHREHVDRVLELELTTARQQIHQQARAQGWPKARLLNL